MVNVKVKLITEAINKGEEVELDSFILNTKALINLAVDHTPTTTLLRLIKERLMQNATKKTTNKLHETELKNFLNAIKDEAA